MAGPSVTGVITLVIIINKIIFCLINNTIRPSGMTSIKCRI